MEVATVAGFGCCLLILAAGVFGCQPGTEPFSTDAMTWSVDGNSGVGPADGGEDSSVLVDSSVLEDAAAIARKIPPEYSAAGGCSASQAFTTCIVVGQPTQTGSSPMVSPSFIATIGIEGVYP